MYFSPGNKVTHSEFGQGTVVQLLGGTAVVNFFGDDIDVDVNQLVFVGQPTSQVVDKTNEDRRKEKIPFRTAFEAINLGVAPSDCGQLIDLTIRSNELTKRVSDWLTNAHYKGLCKVVFGYYGSGKTHMLKFFRCMALQSGWVVAYLEFDPKAADPAKPHLIYQNLMASLEFPERENGSQAEGFMDFIKEVRDNWDQKNIRNNPIFKSNPWFSGAFEILIKYPHMPDVEKYRDACLWLAGDHISFQKINALAREKGLKNKVPRMPVTKETADIYVQHLVVVNALCKLLGYKGLAIIVDEAEHVRGFNVKRRQRATNFFDLLSRAAHIPDTDEDEPVMNDHGMFIPPYWKQGPHFALLVGLTPADIFFDSTLSLREACVFLREEEDKILLSNPSGEDYAVWCDLFLKKFCNFYPIETKIIQSEEALSQVVSCLAEVYQSSTSEISLRHHMKLASLVPCILMSKQNITLEMLLFVLRASAGMYLGNSLPWEK